jgi:hypothetical protein
MSSQQLVVDSVESIIQRDEGNRGISDIFLKGELYKAARSILPCSSIIIITGFPCLLDHSPPTETDGPLGAVAIARALIVLGKKVVILTDECNEEVMLACVASSGIRADKISMESFPGRCEGFDESDLTRLSGLARRCDAVVAIERAGPNSEGACLTMRKRDMSDIVAPLELLFDLAFIADCRCSPPELGEEEGEVPPESLSFVRIGIGDGGNEVGMGKIYDLVSNSCSIPNAAEIACETVADHLLVASVSNWGGYALAAAVAIVAADADNSDSQTGSKLHPELLRRLQVEVDPDEMDTYEFRVERRRREEEAAAALAAAAMAAGNDSAAIRLAQYVDVCLPTAEDEVGMLAAMNAAGARDGITLSLEGMVDGMPIQTSLDILQEIRAACVAKRTSPAAPTSVFKVDSAQV